MGGWGDRETGGPGDGEMGRWGDGGTGRRGDREMGRWGDDPYAKVPKSGNNLTFDDLS